MANKYLDNVGLDHMWDKIKTYLTNNYAAKSHTHTIAQITSLQTTLNGKANSSHTHTASQITDLSSSGYLKVNSPVTQDYGTITSSGTTTKTYTIPAMAANSVTPFFVKATAKGPNNTTSSTVNIQVKAPSGGKYVTEEGYVVNGGSVAKSAKVRSSSSGFPASDVAGGLLIRLS